MDPARVVCALTASDDVLDREIVLSRCDGSSFAIHSAKSSSDSISVRIEPVSSPSRWTLLVRVDGTSLRRRVLIGDVTISTDVDDEPTVVVPVVVTRLNSTNNNVVQAAVCLADGRPELSMGKCSAFRVSQGG